jgi:hypothetical protein
VGVAAIALTLLIALGELNTRYNLNHVSSTWMAQAQALDYGLLYPELFDGTHYGGTRFMPVPIILNWLGSKLTGEYLISGKAVSLFTWAAMLLVVFATLRRVGVPRALILGLFGVIVTTRPIHLAATTVRADLLPIVLSVSAMWLIVRFETVTRRTTVLAATLCAAAVLSKIGSLWAGAAIGVWLLIYQRHNFRWFAIGWAGTLCAGLVLFAAISQGRIFENPFGLSHVSHGGIASIFAAPFRLMDLCNTNAVAAWFLIHIALVVPLIRRPTPSGVLFPLALFMALGNLTWMLADAGVHYNHLASPVVLAAMGVAVLIRDPACAAHGTVSDADPQPPAQAWQTRTVLAVALWAMTLSQYSLYLQAPAEQTIRRLVDGKKPLPRYDPSAFVEALSGKQPILSDDPFVPISLGQRPVVLDAWMLNLIEQHRPGWTQGLVARIERREFEAVVLSRRLERVGGIRPRPLFGRKISTAIAKNYLRAASVGGHHLYLPTQGR